MKTDTEGRFAALSEVVALMGSHATRFVRIHLACALLLLTTSATLSALGPVLLKFIVDELTVRSTGSSTKVILFSALFVLCLWLGRTTGEIRGLTYARAERRLSRLLAHRLFGHVIRLPFQFHVERQATGAVTQILSNGRLGCQMVLHTLVFTILPVLIEVATMVVVLSRLHQPGFLLLFCAAVGCYAAVFCYAARRIMAVSREVSSEQVEANTIMADSFANFESIMCCTGEAQVAAEVDVALTRAEDKEVDFYRRFAFNGIGVATIYTAFLAGTLWYAIQQVHTSGITMGTFVLLITYMIQVVRPVEQLGYAVQSLSQGLAYLDKMIDLLRERTTDVGTASRPSRPLTEPPVPVSQTPSGVPSPRLYGTPRAVSAIENLSLSEQDAAGEVVFENVSCSYRQRPVVRNVSFEVPRAQTVGLVGASGSGKSTLGRLLVRLIEPDSGQILLDGVSISALPLEVLRQSIAVVPQDIALFSKSIYDNIAFGQAGSTREEVESAARVAHLHEWVLSLPEGYGTKVGQRGLQLSGGERQRLAIARAAIRLPRVWVFDEATSALDGPTQRQILGNLREIARPCTALVIAHRLSAVVDADEILVLEGGVIVERGTHAALLSEEGRYAELWATQQHGSLAA